MTDIAQSVLVPAPAIAVDQISEEDRMLLTLLRRDVPLSNVVDVYDEIDSALAAEEAAFSLRIAALRHRKTLIRAIADARFRDERRTKFNHPSFEMVGYEPGKPIVEKRVEVLQSLVDRETGECAVKHPDGTPIVPKDVLAKAIALKPAEPTWYTHQARLEELAAYGPEIADIIARGVVKTTTPDVLVFKRPKNAVANVTGTI
jgi:hypothetical protein